MLELQTNNTTHLCSQ